MGKLWLNNEIVDRLAMLQQTEVGHPGVNQVAIEKDWWVTAEGIIPNRFASSFSVGLKTYGY